MVETGEVRARSGLSSHWEEQQQSLREGPSSQAELVAACQLPANYLSLFLCCKTEFNAQFISTDTAGMSLQQMFNRKLILFSAGAKLSGAGAVHFI